MEKSIIRGIRALACAACLTTCGGGGDGPPEQPGLADGPAYLPYPSMQLMREDPVSSTGYRVHVPEGLLPVATDGTPVKVDRYNRLDGFSVAGPCMVHFDGVMIDPDSFPGQQDIAGSVEPDSTIQIVDLETGDRHPFMAELDANPRAIEQERQALIIRPMRAYEWSHHYAVVIGKGVKQADGSDIPVPRNFRGLVQGKSVHEDLEPLRAHYETLFSDLEAFGYDMDEVLIAWDFWTASEEVTLATMDRVVEGVREDVPIDPDFVPTYTIRESRYLDADEDPDVDPLIWRHVEIDFEMVTYVDENGEFVLDEDGLPTPQGRDEFVLLINVPASVHDAEPGTVPVIVFGHGLLGMPDDYITRGDDALKALYSSDRYGMIYAAAEWRGLSWRDELDAVTAATDWGQFNRITEDLHMGIASFLASGRMFRGGFADEEFLLAADGTGSLVDRDRIYYYGISLGGHQGGVTLALSEVFDFGILQVGGCPWSTMLERSSNWAEYDIIMRSWVPDPLDRQILVATSQLNWDPVDPGTYHDRLAGKSILLQEAIGDAQVPNISTEFWARSIGIPLVSPAPTHPPFLDEVDPPLGPGSSALFQYDPMSRPEGCGDWPPEANFPAEDNCAHGSLRRSEPHHQQVEAFFADGAEGTIIHPEPCGDDPCVP